MLPLTITIFSVEQFHDYKAVYVSWGQDSRLFVGGEYLAAAAAVFLSSRVPIIAVDSQCWTCTLVVIMTCFFELLTLEALG